MTHKNHWLIALALATTPLFADEFKGPVVVKNKAFVYQGHDQNGNDNSSQRLYVRGLVYQSKDRFDDLADSNFLNFKENILPLLKQANVNAIRVYQVDPEKSHKKIMDLLKSNGIYVLIGLVTNKPSSDGAAQYLNRVDPQYNHVLRKRMFNVVNEFYQFDNVLGFSVGNEVVWPGNILGDPSVKQDKKKALELMKYDALAMKLMIQDVKEYISELKERGIIDRLIPVGMAIQDTPTEASQGLVGNVDVVANYYACGKPADRADFIGYNTYAYLPGGPANAYQRFSRYINALPIPGIFTESGAQDGNSPRSRDWKIVTYIAEDPKQLGNLAGHFSFRLMQRNENLGLYYDPLSPQDHSNKSPDAPRISKDLYYQPTPDGGSGELHQVYGEIAAKVFDPVETSSIQEVACPKNFIPGEVDRQVTFYNHADKPVLLMQNGRSYGFVPGKSDDDGVGKKVLGLSSAHELLVLLPEGSYPLICKVDLSQWDGVDAISNDVPWGKSCNLSPQISNN